MSGHVDNAFTRQVAAGGGVRSKPMPPLHATMSRMAPTDTVAGELAGVAIEIDPMRAVDALAEARRPECSTA